MSGVYERPGMPLKVRGLCGPPVFRGVKNSSPTHTTNQPTTVVVIISFVAFVSDFYVYSHMMQKTRGGEGETPTGENDKKQKKNQKAIRISTVRV